MAIDDRAEGFVLRSQPGRSALEAGCTKHLSRPPAARRATITARRAANRSFGARQRVAAAWLQWARVTAFDTEPTELEFRPRTDNLSGPPGWRHEHGVVMPRKQDAVLTFFVKLLLNSWGQDRGIIRPFKVRSGTRG